jgi:uncharacterized repeat protein (TIGR02543 family)
VSKRFFSRSVEGWHSRTAKYLVYLLFAGIIPTGLVASAPTAQAAGTITFNANYTGAPVTTKTQVVSGATTTLEANTFVRPGYTFIGWSTTVTNWSVTNGAGSFGALIADGQTNYAVPASITLYANWLWDFANTKQLTNLTSGVVTTSATHGVQTSGTTTLGQPALIQSNIAGTGLYYTVTSPRNYACSASDLIHNAFDKVNNSRFCINNANSFTTDWQTGGIVFSYQAPVIANGIGITSANDTPARDPSAWTLLGSNTSATGPWTSIKAHTYSSTVPDASASRSAPYPDVYFENPTGYKFYQFVVNQVSGTLATTLAYQLAELKLLYNPAPVLSAPQIVGAPQVGITMAASSGPIGGGTTGLSLGYQWQIATSAAGPFTNISGATNPTYVPVADDAGDYLQVVVTASNAAGSSVATTPITGPVAVAASSPWPTGLQQSQTDIRFTSCGISGPTGPTVANCQSAYTSQVISSAITDGSVITYTTTQPHNFYAGESVTISGINQTATGGGIIPATGYNVGSVKISEIVSPTRFNVAANMLGAVYSSAGTVVTTAPAWLSNTSAYNVVDGYQYWTVPVTGTYQITAYGAAGTAQTQFSYASYGANVSAKIDLIQGQVLKILVGQVTNSTTTWYNTGGGGTFVAALDNTPLLVAGGGGGSGSLQVLSNAPTTVTTLAAGNYVGARVTTPTNSPSTYPGTGGRPESGTAGVNPTYAPNLSRISTGGAGFLTDAATMPGSAFINGGIPTASLGTFLGGFGGGGSAGYTGAGGGGGWSGGAGAYHNEQGGSVATGGGSFIAASATSPTVGLSPILGNGSVAISLVTPISTPPINTGAPIISTPNGSKTFGEVVTTNNGTWNNASTYTYQWFSCASAGQLEGCTVVPNESATTLVTNYLVDARFVFSAVTATSPSGAKSVAYSNLIGPFQNAALFTTCDTTGSYGPGGCSSSYANASVNKIAFPTVKSSAPNLSGVSNGFQYWVVPVTGTYRIKSMGSSIRREASGYAAVASGDLALTAGDVLKIAVGQSGTEFAHYRVGGSGGSFVARVDNTPLVVAGGAGGIWVDSNMPAANTLGSAPIATVTLTGTFNGATATAAGASSAWNQNGTIGNNATGSGSAMTTYSGAGGFFTDGENNPNSAFVKGALGSMGIDGGFGGGSGTASTTWMYGGGGGWAGGASAFSVNGSTNINFAGGGASFIANGFTNVSVVRQPNFGPGQVQIALLSTSDAPRILVAPVETATSLISGGRFSVTAGTWSNSPTSMTYQWFSCAEANLSSCTATAGETGTSLNLTYLQDARFVVAQVIATNAAGTSRAWSNIMGPVRTAALFTSCGIDGPYGPTTANCNTTYATDLVNTIAVSTVNNSSPRLTGGFLADGYQYWTVPATATYRIQAMGASKSGTSGYGAIASADVNLIKGQILKILVGQSARNSGEVRMTSGNGGSFVAFADNTPIVVGGGAGGADRINTLASAPVASYRLPSGSGNYVGALVTNASAGVGTNAGATAGDSSRASAGASNNVAYAGGAGFLQDSSRSGTSFVNGGKGGFLTGWDFNYSPGFGGGGSAASQDWYHGGGGGWAGGGTAYNQAINSATYYGGGAASFVAASAANASISQQVNLGSGQVLIGYLSSSVDAASLPVNTIAPALTDSVTVLSVGDIATISTGTWSGTATDYSYSLLACPTNTSLTGCSAIANSSGVFTAATATAQILSNAFGKYVVAMVTAGTFPNAAVAYSNFVGPFMATLSGGLPDSTLPAPTSLTAAFNAGTVTLTWPAAAGVSSYRLDYKTRPIGTSTWLPANGTTLITGSTGNVLTFNYRLPNPGYEYFFNIYGSAPNGDYSVAKASSDVISNFVATSAPLNLVATSGGVQAVNLAWQAPANLNGLTIAGYRIEFALDAAFTNNLIVAAPNTGTPNTLTYTVPGLRTGTLYFFRVAAIGSRNGTLYTSTYTTTIYNPTTLSNPVINLSATASDRQVALTWGAPIVGVNGSSDSNFSGVSGNRLIGYRVEQSTDPNFGTLFLVSPLTTTLGYTVSSLTNGVTYYFRITPLTAIGAGVPNIVSVMPYALPTAPLGLTAVAGDGQVQLSWQAPYNTGGSPIIGYSIEASYDYNPAQTYNPSQTDPNYYYVVTPNTGSTATTFTVLGLQNQRGNTFAFRVSAITAATQAFQIDTTQGSRVGTGPGAIVLGYPTNLTRNTFSDISARPGDGQVTLGFSGDMSTSGLGGPALMGWQIEQSTNGQSYQVISPYTSNASNVISGLINGQEYCFRITPMTSLGIETPRIICTKPFTIPGTPAQLTATAGSNQVTLNWKAPIVTGGVTQSGYQITYGTCCVSPGNYSSFTYTTVPSSANSTIVTGLRNGQIYYFMVQAISSAGQRLFDYPGAMVSAIPTSTPSEVTNFYLNMSTSNSGTLYWGAPLFTGGVTITGYRVEQSNDGTNWTVITSLTSENSLPLSGLTPGQTTFYRVTALNVNGAGIPGLISVSPT